MQIDWNSLLDVPFEKWRAHGVSVKAVSAGPLGIVNSFLASYRGRRYYGFRKYRQGCPVFADPYFEVSPA